VPASPAPIAADTFPPPPKFGLCYLVNDGRVYRKMGLHVIQACFDLLGNGYGSPAVLYRFLYPIKRYRVFLRAPICLASSVDGLTRS
jgi:hypothetical protein